MIYPTSGKKCKRIALNDITEDVAMDRESIETATNDPDFAPTFDSSLPDEVLIEASEEGEIDDLDWVKENATIVREFQHHESI